MKRRELADGVVGAVIGPATLPEAIVLDRFTDAELLIVGRTARSPVLGASRPRH